MIGQKFNMDEVFFRDLTVAVLDTLEGRLNWVNRFTSGDVNVQVPIYYSMTGDERFLLDSFQDDIVSENRYVEFNTDIIPRGQLTLNNFSIKSDEFRNPNVWLRAVVEDTVEVKRLLKKVRAIPITVNYDLVILLKNEIDVFKCAQEIMNTLWLYKFIYFEHNYMNIDAILTMPDTENIDIIREKNLTSDNTIKLTLILEVQTYYPAFSSVGDAKIKTQAYPVSTSESETSGVGGSAPASNNEIKTNSLQLGPMFYDNLNKPTIPNSISTNQQIIGANIPNGTFITGVEIKDGQTFVKISKFVSFPKLDNNIISSGSNSSIGGSTSGSGNQGVSNELNLNPDDFSTTSVPISQNIGGGNIDTSGSEYPFIEVTILLDPVPVIQPYKSRWFKNNQTLAVRNTTGNRNANYNNPNFNSNQK